MGSRSKGTQQLPITRRQQVEALRTMKANEVASHLADRIREAVRQEVERQLQALRDTMVSCLDRIMDLEGHLQRTDATYEGGSDDRSEREEAAEVSVDTEVVPDQGVEGTDPPDPTGA